MSTAALAKTLKDVFNTTNPEPLPSGDPRYVDCTDARGNEDVVREMLTRILWWDKPSPITQLFTGHLGSGKSTELLRLQRRLEDAGYVVIYFVTSEFLELNDLVYSDVLVAIAQQVFNGLQSLNVRLDDELLDPIFAWFADIVFEKANTREFQAELGAEFSVGPKILTPLAQLLAKITGQLRTGVESRQQIRSRLDPEIAQLIDRINLLIMTGTVELRKRGKKGLVIIADNLDKIPMRWLDAGRSNHDALYIEHGEQLRALRCHVIYTVPISLFYSPKTQLLTGAFPNYTVLAMIKEHSRDNQPYQEGLDKLRQILGERIALDEVFTEKALDMLCAESGGHPRFLMTLVRYSAEHAEDRYPKPIGETSAERAIARLTSEFSRSIPEEHFPLLAKVYRTKQIRNDSDHQLMLHTLSVLEYRNGGEPWYDVHPSVRRLAKFREALTNA